MMVRYADGTYQDILREWPEYLRFGPKEKTYPLPAVDLGEFLWVIDPNAFLQKGPSFRVHRSDGSVPKYVCSICRYERGLVIERLTPVEGSEPEQFARDGDGFVITVETLVGGTAEYVP